MTIHLPALPALVAGRALQSDCAEAARRALEEVRNILTGFDLARGVVHDLPAEAAQAMAAALARRLTEADRKARACRERLDEIRGFCTTLHATESPVAMVAVSEALWEMLSPYVDEAMAPVIDRISGRVGCSPEEAAGYFPAARPAMAA